MSADVIPFNPLDKHNLGASVAEAMLNKADEPLSGLTSFKGAGIYALYYRGPHAAYHQLAAANANGAVVPIYVGKAVPAGTRKGTSVTATANTRALFLRLQEHAESIKQVTSLSLDDFTCRYLVVDDIWIPLGESLLIAKFSPVWNNVLDGFGNHDPGAGRYQGQMPRWDVLHPGRAWALKCQPRTDSQQNLELMVQTYLSNNPLPHSVHVLQGK